MKANRWQKLCLIFGFLYYCNSVALAIEPEFATEVTVQTGKIIRTTLHRNVIAYGMVEPQPEMRGKPAASSKVAAPMPGILAQVYCEEGQYVKKGDLLFALDTRNADALIAKAEVTVAFAEKNFARKQQLNNSENVSRKLYDEAEQLLQTARKDLANAQTQRALLQIRAPLSGTVAVIHFKIGEAVNLSTILAEVINLNQLDIAIRVPSQEAARVRLKQPVAVHAGSTWGTNRSEDPHVHTEIVSFIGAQVDPLTDTVLVRASLNAVSDLRAGQFVSIRILVEVREQVMAVPIESVVTRDGVSVIAVVTGDRAKQQTITTGLREGQLVEVAGAHLQEGMTIVTQGAYGLPAETRIKVLP